MNALFVGLGSIGCRHLKNLKALSPDITVDALRSSARPLSTEISSLLHRELYSFDDIDTEYDICFITGPTQLHYEHIVNTLSNVRYYFVEKPIFGEPCELPFMKNQTVYVAAPLRHSKLFSVLKDFLKNEKPLAARAICSSYLPNWRPGTDYRKCYSAIKEQGGGVRLDLIHEWDYLCALFGNIDRLKSFCGNLSNLEIDSEDFAIYIAKAGEVAISVHLDYFGKEYNRKCEIICENGNITADFGSGELTHYEKGTIDCKEDANEKYLREMRHFLEITNGGNNINDAECALATLKTVLSCDF